MMSPFIKIRQAWLWPLFGVGREYSFPKRISGDASWRSNGVDALLPHCKILASIWIHVPFGHSSLAPAGSGGGAGQEGELLGGGQETSPGRAEQAQWAQLFFVLLTSLHLFALSELVVHRAPKGVKGHQRALAEMSMRGLH